VTAIATYSFLPWLRNGIANTIATADGDTTVTARAKIHIDLTLSGDPVSGDVELTQDIAQDIALYGPGDIVGIDSRAIVRTEPRNWITNFESNYLPAIDFYDEDFPWRYTPAAPDGTGLQLRPWIALIVLKGEETEFREGTNIANRPLPYITVADTGVFPPADELWAWAHVHFNQGLSAGPDELVSPDMSAVLPRVQAALAQNPDIAYSRIVCPRRLDENTGYHAFVVPVFETGRLAGLGEKPDLAPHATFSAWAPYANKPEPTNFPIYYRWYFRTGSLGDFEYLVRLIKPQPVDPRVGTRDMDVQDPSSNIPGIADAALGGVLRLGGALRVPDADLSPEQLADRQKYENWDQPYPHPFQKALAAFINLPDDYAATIPAAANAATVIGPGISDDPDPLITAPLYGRWHALTPRLLTRRDGTPALNSTNWVHKLNLDPRFRVAANFGTDVVESNAESYMNAAWEQIGDVLAANQRIRRLQLATAVASRWFDNHLTPLAAANPERAFTLGAPMAGRILVSGTPIAHAQAASLVTPTMTSTALRRVLRPNSRLINALPFNATVRHGNLLARVNAGEVSAAPPKVVPSGVPTIDQAAGAAAPSGVPNWIVNLLRRFPWLPVAVFAIAAILALVLIIALPVIGFVLAAVVLALGFYLFRMLQRWGNGAAAVRALQEADQTPSAVDVLPNSPNFVLSIPGSNVRPAIGSIDSPVATRFKSGLRDSFSLLQGSASVGAQPARATLDLRSLTTTVVAAIDPRVTIFKRGLTAIVIPSRIAQLLNDPTGDVMAYPKIDLPMYLPLKTISIELFLPRINLIAPNSITLIETNRKFVESYMVGLNHEFSRKLLWREYPTDMRGSYFRQFWDVSGYFNSENLDPQTLKEQLYDIPELHSWPPDSFLGDHNNRNPGGETGEDAVLVIRGELLKKYPTAVIYAHRAQWETNPDGSIDPTQPRKLVDLTSAEEQSPPRTKVRTPLYEAKADPDIYFFGFDLTIAEAQGQPGTNPGDDPGWFFVIKERPGEPRFGLELTRSGDLEIFGELTWDDALPGAAPGQFLPANALGSVQLVPVPPPDSEGKQPQHDDDAQVNAAAISSARWAYLLLRAPVIVAIHAAEMLGQGV
jgi:hypothetical protein